MVVPGGFEPPQRESKSLMLPLHKGTIEDGQSGGIRTHDFSVPSGARYQTALLTVAVVTGFEPVHPELTARTDTFPDIPQFKIGRPEAIRTPDSEIKSFVL